MSPAPKVSILHDRAAMFRAARRFFADRDILEVDCPIISVRASVDAHIDLIPAAEGRYLHSSPEYGMKRLLADGIGDIYQLSHVFRNGEVGSKHNPEFMMAEWYRIGISFQALMEETADFIRLFLGDLPHRIISYREAFKEFAGIDYISMNDDQLMEHVETGYDSLKEEGRDAILNMILGTHIEPLLGNDELTILAYYPATQAALAKTTSIENELVAERFEIYYKGMELCNGYHELADADEQRQRFIASNAHRRRLGKEELPLDEHFLESLKRGLPDCCGVAVGFDRLMMLRHQCDHIRQAIPFEWDIA